MALIEIDGLPSYKMGIFHGYVSLPKGTSFSTIVLSSSKLSHGGYKFFWLPNPSLSCTESL